MQQHKKEETALCAEAWYRFLPALSPVCLSVLQKIWRKILQKLKDALKVQTIVLCDLTCSDKVVIFGICSFCRWFLLWLTLPHLIWRRALWCYWSMNLGHWKLTFFQQQMHHLKRWNILQLTGNGHGDSRVCSTCFFLTCQGPKFYSSKLYRHLPPHTSSICSLF